MEPETGVVVSPKGLRADMGPVAGATGQARGCGPKEAAGKVNFLIDKPTTLHSYLIPVPA